MNDLKLTSYRTALARSDGTVNDLEMDLWRTVNGASDGTWQRNAYEHLGTLGYQGTLPDRLFGYYQTSTGLTSGTRTDLESAWLLGGGPDSLLSGGAGNIEDADNAKCH